jgi:hypothetical protein
MGPKAGIARAARHEETRIGGRLVSIRAKLEELLLSKETSALEEQQHKTRKAKADADAAEMLADAVECEFWKIHGLSDFTKRRRQEKPK